MRDSVRVVGGGCAAAICTLGAVLCGFVGGWTESAEPFVAGGLIFAGAVLLARWAWTAPREPADDVFD